MAGELANACATKARRNHVQKRMADRPARRFRLQDTRNRMIAAIVGSQKIRE